MRVTSRFFFLFVGYKFLHVKCQKLAKKLSKVHPTWSSTLRLVILEECWCVHAMLTLKGPTMWHSFSKWVPNWLADLWWPLRVMPTCLHNYSNSCGCDSCPLSTTMMVIYIYTQGVVVVEWWIWLNYRSSKLVQSVEWCQTIYGV